MKQKETFSVLFFLVVLFLFIAVTVQASDGDIITLTAPNGGEHWYAGDTKVVSWSYQGNPGNKVKIEWINAEDSTATLINGNVLIGKMGSGSYKLKIPAGFQPGNYKIRVTSIGSNSASDISDDSFSIQYLLTIKLAGNGKGNVTRGQGDPCSTNCVVIYSASTPVTLTAEPELGSTFKGWKGSCKKYKKQLTCTVNVNQSTTVTASFTDPTGLQAAKNLISDLRDTARALKDVSTPPIERISDEIKTNIAPELTKTAERARWIIESASSESYSAEETVLIDAFQFLNTWNYCCWTSGLYTWHTGNLTNSDYSSNNGPNYVTGPPDGLYAFFERNGFSLMTGTYALSQDGIKVYVMPESTGIYKVYGGNSIPVSACPYGTPYYTCDLIDLGNNPQNYGFTYLGESNTTQSFSGNYLYYIVKVDKADSGSDSDWTTKTFTSPDFPGYLLTMEKTETGNTFEFNFTIMDSQEQIVDSGLMSASKDNSDNFKSGSLYLQLQSGTGNIIANFDFKSTIADGRVKSVTGTGTISGPDSLIDFSQEGRKLYATFSKEPGANGDIYPASILISGELTSPIIAMSGEFSASAVWAGKADSSCYWDWYWEKEICTCWGGIRPKSVTFKGSIQELENSVATGLKYDGSTTVNWTNAASYNGCADDSKSNYPIVESNFSGTLQAPSFQKITADLGVKSGYRQVNFSTDYTWKKSNGSTVILKGSGTGNSATDTWKASFTNQNKIDLSLNYDGQKNLSGSLKKGSTKLAEIYMQNGICMIKYPADGYIESCF